MKEFIVRQGGGNIGQGFKSRGNTLPLPLGIIEVIHTASISVNISRRKGILSVATPPRSKAPDRPKKRLRLNKDPITFNKIKFGGNVTAA